MSSINPIKHSFNTTLTAIENNPKKTAIIAGSTGAVLAGAGAALLLTVSTITGIALAALAGVALLFAAYQAIKAIKLNKQVTVLNTDASQNSNDCKILVYKPSQDEIVAARLKRKEVKKERKIAARLKEQAAKTAKKAEVDKAAADALANARKNTAGEPNVDVQELSIPNFNWKDVTAAAAKDAAKVAAATVAVAGLGYAAYAYGPAAYVSAKAAAPVVKAAVTNAIASASTTVANTLASAKTAASIATAKTLAYANSYAVPVMIRA